MIFKESLSIQVCFLMCVLLVLRKDVVNMLITTFFMSDSLVSYISCHSSFPFHVSNISEIISKC